MNFVEYVLLRYHSMSVYTMSCHVRKLSPMYLPTDTFTSFSTVVCPMRTQGSFNAVKAEVTRSTFFGRTSRTIPSSSEKSMPENENENENGIKIIVTLI